MSPFLRAFHAIRGAFYWDNPWELLLDYHLLRRSDPIRLLKAGVSLVVNYCHSDMQAAKDILLDGMYDPAFKAAFKDAKNPGAFRYLNLGANIGAFDLRACQVAKLHESNLAGVAVEMNTATFARLVFNLEINRLLAIHPINAALANEDGDINCDLAARDTGQKAGGQGDSTTEHSVPAVSWKTLWGSIAGPDGFDLVKVDIEGAELCFLSNLTPDQAAKIRCIVIETHDSSLHALCDERLPQLGFELLQKDPDSPGTRVSLWERPLCG
jgi:FkbM family methyltransferase